jgi:hypothetical protein
MNGMQQYIENLEEVQRLANTPTPAGVTKEQLIAQIQNNARREYALRCENDQILHQLLERPPESLTETEAEELFEFTNELCHYARGPDTGAAHLVHHLLYEYAKSRGDRNMEIRELYFLGLTLNYLNLKTEGINAFGEKVCSYFRRAATYFDQYDQIEDEQTRDYLIRSLGNCKLGDPRIQGGNGSDEGYNMLAGYPIYRQYFEAAMRVIQSPRYRAMNPNLPWDSYAYAMHFDRTIFLEGLRSGHNNQVAKDVLESAEYVYHHQEQIARVQDRLVGPRTLYVYYCAQYHSGQITAEELVERLLQCNEATDTEDYSEAGIVGNLRIAAAIYWYAERTLTTPQRRRFDERIRRSQDKLINYLHGYRGGEYSRVVYHYAMLMLQTEMCLGTESRARLMRYILVCRPSAYVHSLMVAWLSQRLMQRMIEVAPEKLVGTFDMPDVDAVRTKKNLICARIYECGLYHDIGKNGVLGYISVIWRGLLPEELRCIQYHPQLGHTLLKRVPGCQDEAEVALRHHRFYNEQGGYPMDAAPCPHRLRQVVDIVTVADMLDATTDDIGRCYAQAKPLSQIREELRQGSGTRYSPDCVALLEDAEFYTTLERDIRQERERIYYKIYQSENATAGQSGKTLPPSTTGYLEDVYSPCSRLPAGRLEYPC